MKKAPPAPYEEVRLWFLANLSMAKKLRGLTDKQIADRMGLDVSNVTSTRMQKQVKLSIRKLVAWANALEVTPAQLLTEPENLEAALAIDHRSRPRKPLIKKWRKKSISSMAGL